jgi:hypothetical protein
MAKTEKKIKKLKERIEEMEADMYKELKQKTSSTSEISIHKYQTRLAQMNLELQELEKK